MLAIIIIIICIFIPKRSQQIASQIGTSDYLHQQQQYLYGSSTNLTSASSLAIDGAQQLQNSRSSGCLFVSDDVVCAVSRRPQQSMTNQLMDHHHHSPAAFAKQTDMGASSVPSSAADVDAADAAADATATTVNSDKRRRHKWNRLTKDKLNRKRQKKLQTLVLRAQQRHRVEEQKQNQYKTTTISANSAAAVSGFSSVVGSTSNGSCSPSITSNNPMRTKNVLKQLKQTPQSAAPACSLLLMRPKQTNISSVVMEPVRRKQIELEQLKRKHPMSSFLLGRAQMPLWNLTYNSLSSFGKIA